MTDNEADEVVGYIVEESQGFLKAMSRQLFATHRPFKAIIMDAQGTPVLWVRVVSDNHPSFTHPCTAASASLCMDQLQDVRPAFERL